MITEILWAGLTLNFAATVIAVALSVVAIMAVAVAIKNHSIIDVFWGPGFVIVAAVSYLMAIGTDGDHTRRIVVLVLTALWGLRLGLHIARRNLGHGEDPRYTRLLASRKGASLIPFLIKHIYGMQAALIVIVSLPVQFAMYQNQELGVLGWLGICVWAVGFFFETIGDWQLARFKADPGNDGAIMNSGLWAWTRHPNYFGDSCVWVGLFLLALGNWFGLITVVAPIVMIRLLVSYSGKAMLEKGMRRKRGQAYDDYIANTSGFFPLPPRRRAQTDRQR